MTRPFTQKDADSLGRLFKQGAPKFIRVYEDLKEEYSYTAVFTGNYQKFLWQDRKTVNPDGTQREFKCKGLKLNAKGRFKLISTPHVFDRPGSGYLGKKVRFSNLPEAVKVSILSYYLMLWKVEHVERSCVSLGWLDFLTNYTPGVKKIQTL